MLDKKAELAGIDRKLSEIEGERNRIASDQQRVRENMKALRGSDEERQLLQRYTRQLDEQETRLSTLQQESTRANAERVQVAAELAKFISSVTFEWTVK